MWNMFTESFLHDIMANASADIITANLEKALLLLRILRKLTVFGFYKPHTNSNCMGFLKVIFERAKTTLECSKFHLLVMNNTFKLEYCRKAAMWERYHSIRAM